MAERLDAVADIVEQLPSDAPLPVRLAHAMNGFMTIGVVSGLLCDHAPPFRDAYELSGGWCQQALLALMLVVDQDVAREHVPIGDAATTVFEEMTHAGAFELFASDDADVEGITNAIVRLAADLQASLDTITVDKTAPDQLRAAAAATAPLAAEIWTHYGSDSGGW